MAAQKFSLFRPQRPHLEGSFFIDSPSNGAKLASTKRCGMDKNSKYLELIQPFPNEALSTVRGSGINLTSIDAQYVVERLNEVLGIDGWSTSYKLFREEIEEVVVKCTISGDGWSREAFGGVTNKKRKDGSGWVKDFTDMYKGATTNALCKAASHIGVGNDIYKGLVKPTTMQYSNPPKAPAVKQLQADPGAWVFPKGKHEGKSIKQLYETTDKKNPNKGDLLFGLAQWCKDKDMTKGYFFDFLTHTESFKTMIQKQNNSNLTKPLNGPDFNSKEEIKWT